jgi:hypothetical protein
VIKPGSRQAVAALIFAYVHAPVKPIEPMVSPCLPGFLLKKQGGDPR